jgi:hypothetical protein
MPRKKSKLMVILEAEIKLYLMNKVEEKIIFKKKKKPKIIKSNLILKNILK